VWLREIFSSTFAEGRDDRDGASAIAGLRESESGEAAGRRIRITHESVAPRQGHRKRRDAV
jgi:hypothetical protein